MEPPGVVARLTTVRGRCAVILTAASALFVIGCSSAGGGHATPTTTTVPARPTTTTTAVTAGQFLDATLQPVSIAGYRGPLSSPPLPYSPELDFGSRGKWSGSDGCNSVAGTDRVGTGGSFRLFEKFSTSVGCFHVVPLPFAAARVEVRDDRYFFYTRGGRLLGEYVAAPSAMTTGNPKVRVVPSSGLVDSQRVRVSVTGFGIGAKLRLSECATVSDASDVGCGAQLPEQAMLLTGDDRSGSATFIVHDHAAAKGNDTAEPRLCTSACVVVATQGDDPATHSLGYASAPIDFRANASGPTTTATGTMAGTLRDVGGPAPGIDRAISGPIEIADSHGRVWRNRASGARGFAIRLPAGTYAVHGGGADGSIECYGPSAARVTRAGTTRVQVTCDID